MTDGDREILEHFQRTRERTIELLGRIPDDWLGRTSDGEEHSLGWLFGHIAHGVDHWMEHCMRDGGSRPELNDQNKASLLQSLKASRVRLVSFFTVESGQALAETYTRIRKDSDLKESFEGRNRVLYLAQHEAHHRAKIVLALRQWGITDIPFMPY